MECTSITIHRTVLSSLIHRGFFVSQRGWEKEKKKRKCAGHNGKGKGRRKVPRLFLLPIVPLALSIFRLLLLLLGYPKEASTEKGGFFCTLSIHHHDHDSWTPKMVDQGVTKMSFPRPRPLLPHM